MRPAGTEKKAVPLGAVGAVSTGRPSIYDGRSLRMTARMKVSVCVAATRPDTVGDTVRSITAQTHPDWHLVVVAQGPGAGGVAAAVEQALGDHDRARATVVRQDGTGLSRARNAAVMA